MTLGVYSTMTGMPWGGSEQLWCRSALQLIRQGHDLTVNVMWWPDLPEQLQRLQRQGATLHRRRRGSDRPWTMRLQDGIARRLGFDQYRAEQWLADQQPDLVLVSASWHLDDLSIAHACLDSDIPYVLSLQCASPYHWAGDEQARAYRRAYQNAEHCFFLSKENRRIVETMTGATLPNATIVDNPINVDPDSPPAWPANSDAWRMACVGRLHCKSKGQDLILECLRRTKWRSRNLHVSFYGRDQDSEERLRKFVDVYNLTGQVSFKGHQPLESIWRNNHALLLPSRYEGLPMATLEASLWGRPAVVTDCGRNDVFVDDGETGFLIPAPTASLLDNRLEMAWKRRQDWKHMGAEAAERIRTRYGASPVSTFANHLSHFLQQV
jgi:glycosyltransferase involved in cell wall biosynthesis